jgi:carboxymethylenebutenolidase
MNKHIQLSAGDGFTLDAYVAEPSAPPTAGMVVLQEIFGVNHHIRNVTDRYASFGYLSIAPALFDRAKKNVELAYDDMSGVELRKTIPEEKTILDMKAAVDWLRAHGIARIGVVGYCWGGSLAWFANTRLDVDATVSYYGGMIAAAAEEKNQAPAMFHFGELDKHIGPDHWEKIQAAHPELPLCTYAADHGFNCDERDAYNVEAAQLAQERTLAFFRANLGG